MTGVPETVVEIVHGDKLVKVLSMLRLFLPVVIAAKGAPAHPLVMPVKGTTQNQNNTKKDFQFAFHRNNLMFCYRAGLAASQVEEHEYWQLPCTSSKLGRRVRTSRRGYVPFHTSPFFPDFL